MKGELKMKRKRIMYNGNSRVKISRLVPLQCCDSTIRSEAGEDALPMSRCGFLSCNIRKVLVFIVVGVALVAHARNWYISPAGSDVTGDGTLDNPFKTINRASTNTMFTAGETIYLAPGDYDEGIVEDVATSGGQSYSGFSRVILPKATVIDSILGSAGVEKTRIVGRRVDDPNGRDGCGYGAVRCIHARAANIHVRNVTLADGCTTWTNANGNADFDTQQGGAVRSVNSATYLVNCIVTNCSGRGSAIYNATVIRCKVLGGGGLSTLRMGKAYFSFFDGNAPSSAVISFSTLVNCTVVNTASPLYQGATSYAVNTIHALYSGGIGLAAVPGENNYAVPKSSFGILKNPFINPFDGDYRIRKKDTCRVSSYVTPPNGELLENLADRGDRSLLSTIDVPEEYEYTGDRIHLGCFEAVSQSGGGLYVDEKCIVNGKLLTLTDAKNAYFGFPLSYPKFYKVVQTGEHPERALYNFWRPANCGSGLFPEPDGSVCVLTRPDTNVTMTLHGQLATETIFVDGESENADDCNPGTEIAPVKTIQAAVDKARTSLPLILVKPGTYTGTNVCVVSDGGVPCAIRAVVVLTNRTCVIRSTGGSAVTFIKGAADPDTNGLGPNAVRCVYVKNALTASGQLQGFTLTGGYSDGVSAGPDCRRGAIVSGNGCDKFTVSDCVAENCTGADSLIINVFVKRCRIQGNRSKANLIEASYVSTSVIADNISEGSSLLTGLGHYFSSTFYGNVCSGTIWGSAYIWFFNCLLDGNGTTAGMATDRGGNFAWNFASPQNLPVGFVQKDAYLADPGNGDFRLSMMSPAIDAGARASQILADTVAPYISTTDLSCQVPRVTDGVMTPGAMQSDFVPGVYISCPYGGLAIESGNEGLNPISGGKTLVISGATGGVRPCVGYLLNGVTNLFAVVPSRVITADDLSEADGHIMIEAIYTKDWYVDAQNGDDSNSGFLPTAAFRTLKAALTASGLAAGDTVHAAAGTYAAETMPTEVTNSTVAASRASVPPGVTLEGANARTTVIRGGALIHCVSLMDGSRVRNFTLTGADLPREDGGEGKTYPGESDTGAAAVLGYDENQSIVENCIISNNVAFRRAAGYKCTFVRCLIAGNVSDTAPAGAYATYHHCLVDGNRGTYTAMYSSFYNTTFTANNTAIGGEDTVLAYYYSSPGFSHSWDNGYRALNSVFPGMVSTNHCYRYCALTDDVMTGGRYIDAEIAGEGSILAHKGAFVFDESGTPMKENPVVDSSDAARVQNLMKPGDSLDVDLSGGQRIWNAKMDMGCLEYDWRNAFAKDLTTRRDFVVVAAAPMVCETAERKVKVSADNGLTAFWSPRTTMSRNYKFRVHVSGAGALTVKLNGETLAGSPVSEADGAKTLSFSNGQMSNLLEFVFDGDGSADLSDFACTGAGIMILVQ